MFGEDSRRLSKAARQRIGYLSEDEFPYDDITVVDALQFVRGFFDEWDWDWVDHLVDRLGVDRKKRLDGMSKGQLYLNGHNIGRYFSATHDGKAVAGQRGLERRRPLGGRAGRRRLGGPVAAGRGETQRCGDDPTGT